MFHKEWWRIKNLFARNMIDRKKYNLAYKLTSSHKNGYCGIDDSNAEFLSGWIAHSFLKKPDIAYTHFENMYKIVSKPISLAKASYWAGISAKAMKDKEKADKWLKKASKYNFIFYGQMALLELGHKNITFPPSGLVTRQDKINYTQNEYARAFRILIKHRRINDAFEFSKVAVDKSNSPGEISLMISDIRKTQNKFHIGVLAKMASYKNYMLVADNYQTPYKVPKNSKVELALTYSIMMKESGFDHRAISRANAHGLMQMIPQTGCDMQRSLKMKCSVRRLTSDPHHNIMLGNKYLAELIGSYKGSYILTFATYNAGPEPVKKWIKKNGDPRTFKTKEQVIHWIESVPYYETRDYIKRVLEYLQVYREVLDQKSRLELEKDLFRGGRAA
jgi:soluble lytic murein transglycosylase